MSLSLRLRALEQLARSEGLLTGEPPCSKCGGPRPNAYGGRVIDVDAGEALQNCELCNRALDKDDRALGDHAAVIYLHRGRHDVPMPE